MFVTLLTRSPAVIHWIKLIRTYKQRLVSELHVRWEAAQVKPWCFDSISSWSARSGHQGACTCCWKAWMTRYVKSPWGRDITVVCPQPAATLLSTGSRHHGSPQGIRLGFPPFSLVSAGQGIYQHLNQMQLTFVTHSCMSDKLRRKCWFVWELHFPGLIFDHVLMTRSVWKGVTCAYAGTSCWSRTVQTILVIVAIQIVHDLISNDKIKKKILINFYSYQTMLKLVSSVCVWANAGLMWSTLSIVVYSCA